VVAGNDFCCVLHCRDPLPPGLGHSDDDLCRFNQKMALSDFPGPEGKASRVVLFGFPFLAFFPLLYLQQPNSGSCLEISPLGRATRDLCFRGDVVALGPLRCLWKGRGSTHGRSKPPSWGNCSSCLLPVPVAPSRPAPASSGRAELWRCPSVVMLGSGSMTALGCGRCGETGAGPVSWGQFGGSHPSQCTWALPQVAMAPGSMREQRCHFPKRRQRGGCSRSEGRLKEAWPALGPPLPQLRPAAALRSRKALLRSTAYDILSG